MSPSLEEQWTYFGWQGVCGALIEGEVTLVAVNLLLNLKAIDPVCLFILTREVLLDMSGPFGSPLGHDDSDVNEIKDAGLHHHIRSVVILSALTRQKNKYVYLFSSWFLLCFLCWCIFGQDFFFLNAFKLQQDFHIGMLFANFMKECCCLEAKLAPIGLHCSLLKYLPYWIKKIMMIRVHCGFLESLY